jgi:hypothetical protein
MGCPRDVEVVRAGEGVCLIISVAGEALGPRSSSRQPTVPWKAGPRCPRQVRGRSLQIFNRLLHIFRVHPKDGALLEARLGLGWKRAERTPVLLSSRSPQPVCCLAAAHRGWKSTLRRTAAAGRHFSPKSKTPQHVESPQGDPAQRAARLLPLIMT